MELYSNLCLLNEDSGDDTNYKNHFIALEKDVLEFYHNFLDDPEILSGWGHNYFCEEDGGRLVFNTKTPKSHICEVCGRLYNSEKKNSSWVYLYRYKAFETVYKAAILYKFKKDPFMLIIVVKILKFYAVNYSKFKIHAKDKVNVIENGVTGFGKIMPQALNEAIMLISIINTLQIISSYISTKDKRILDTFVDEVALFLFYQRSAYHNIICWIDCAITSAGIYLDTEIFIESGINSKYGLINQLDFGLSQDYFWYEGSFHYHFFIIEALLNLLLSAKHSSFDFTNIEELTKKMLLSASSICFDNLVLPNPNDGWPNISLKTYTHLFELADNIFDDKEISDIVIKIRNSKLYRQILPLCEPIFIDGISLNQILYSRVKENRDIEDPTGKSIIFKDSGFAIIKNSIFNLFTRFLHKSQSHAHPDLGSFEITIKDNIISRDLSNTGYGTVLYDEWYKTSLAHNTVVIGGKDQIYTELSNVLSFNENGINTRISECYEDTEFRRNISVEEKFIHDYFIVDMKNEKIADYVIHIDAESISTLETIDADILFNSNGYQHLSEIKKVISTQPIIDIKWSKNKTLFTTRFFIENKEMFWCKSYDNPSSKLRDTIILRSYGKKLQFEMLIIAE